MSSGDHRLADAVEAEVADGEFVRPRVLLLDANHRRQAQVIVELTETSRLELEVIRAMSPEEAARRLAYARFDAALVALDTGSTDSLEALRELRSSYPDVPIIAYSDAQSELLTVEAVRAGAQEFVSFGDLDHPSPASGLRSVIERQLLSRELGRRSRELDASESRLRTIVETCSDALIIVNNAGLVRYANKAAMRMFPGRGALLVGSQFGFPLVEGKGVELDIVRHDSAPGVAEMRAVPIVWGEEAAQLAILRDVTERKSAELRIAQLNRTLEERVASRTAELVAANRELEAFSYSISHDLGSPLLIIDCFVRALLELGPVRLGEEGMKSVGHIRDAGDRMRSLIDDLLRLSRVSREQLRRVPTNLTAIAADIVADLRKLEPDREVECILSPTPQVNVDPGLMRVALENLYRNAWKFTSRTARARIEFSADTPGENVIFRIRDNGAGFDRRDATGLFGPFKRLHRNEEFSGTGIGLSIVERIMQRHNGSVRGEGELGVGATFFLSVPRRMY